MTKSKPDDLRPILQAILERLDKIEATIKLLGPIPPAPYYPMIYPIPCIIKDTMNRLLKTMPLLFRCQQAGRSIAGVYERLTSRTRSNCGTLSGPQGVNGLRVREWRCVDLVQYTT